MAFGDLVVKLNADISDFTQKLSTAQKQMNAFTSTAGSKTATTSKAVTGFADSLASKYSRATSELKKHNLGLKDTARIVQGIMISQAFYQVAGSIREATSALLEFNENLDYAQVTYSALFGSSTLATEFLDVLQEHSINTIFDYDTLAQASKKLLAYGIEYKNLMYVMGGLTNLGAMSGDSAAMDRVAYAIGQIYAKGTLKAEEMRQLANAYVPIQQILKDEFGLTEDQLGNVGDLAIPAEDAINAIVDYANEQFGAVGEAAMLTLTGLKNRVRDTLKVMGASMLEPLTTTFKSFLVYVDKVLGTLREAYEAKGMGGILDVLVPDEGQQEVIRQFITNIKNAFVSLLNVLRIVGTVLKNVGTVFVSAFNIVAPVVMTVTNAITQLLSAMLSTRAGTWLLRTAILAAATALVLFRMQAIGALVITMLTKVVMGLGNALMILATIIVNHPIIAVLTVLGVALTAAAASSDKLRESLSKLFGKLSSPFKSSEALTDTSKEITNIEDATKKFNERFETSGDLADRLADKVTKASKRASKSLLSFDEVFRLTEDTSDTSGGIEDSLTDLLDGIGGIGDLSDLLEVPDFSDWADRFTLDLTDALREKIGGAGIGALLGGLLGAAIGGVPGAIIGAAIGGLVGWFWGEIARQLGLSDAGTVAIPIATGLGAAIGFLIGGPPGALVGAGIGALTGFLIDGIASGLETGDWSNVAAPLGAGLGAAIGFVIGGGPLGAAIGALAGTIVGGLIGVFTDPDTMQSIKDWFGELNTKLENWRTDTNEKFEKWRTETRETFNAWETETKEKLTTWVSDTAMKFALWAGETALKITEWRKGNGSAFKEWVAETVVSIASWSTETSEKIASWATEVSGRLEAWRTETNEKFSTWQTENREKFDNWKRETKEVFMGWVAETAVSISSWVSETAANLESWRLETNEKFSKWQTENREKFDTWKRETKEKITTWVAETAVKFSSWAAETGAKFIRWRTGARGAIVDWAAETSVKIGTWVTDTKEKFSGWYTKVKEKIDAFKSISFTDWCNLAWKALGEWADNVWSKINDKIGKAIDKVKEFFDLGSDNTDFNVNTNVSTSTGTKVGHATGGIFNREHVAKFAEGNKAEAIIPLENSSAMQPFVDAVANGLTASLAPILATVDTSSQLQPLYVGTLIADDRSLKELERKMKVIRLQEERR